MLIEFTLEYSQNINFTPVVDFNIDNKYLFSNVLFKYFNLVQVLNQHWRFDRHIFNIMKMYNQYCGNICIIFKMPPGLSNTYINKTVLALTQ